MDLALDRKCVAVSGATRGIGLAIAKEFAREGSHVAICSRNSAEADAVAGDLGKNSDGKIIGHGVDVSDTDAVNQWIESVGDAFGGIDIVVANVSALAGVPDEDSWRMATEIDMLGTVRLVDASMPYLEQSAAASIVAISSTAALEAFGGARPYNAIKAALINYMSNLATALAPKGIRANTVSPGTIFFEDGVWGTRKREQPDIYNAALAHNPMGRMGTPEEVAAAVAFVASPRSGFTTGANIVVDGGFTRRIQY